MVGVPDEQFRPQLQDNLRALQGALEGGTFLQDLETEPEGEKIPWNQPKCGEIADFGSSDRLSTRANPTLWDQEQYIHY